MAWPMVPGAPHNFSKYTAPPPMTKMEQTTHECMDTGSTDDSKTAYPIGVAIGQEQAAPGGKNTFSSDSSSFSAPEATNTVPVEGEGQRRKRGRETCGGEERVVEVEKRGCTEGMSWWTCLMLDMNHEENTRAQVAVRKVHSINHN